MCTAPVLSGTATSRQVFPWSDEIITALVSSSPTHLAPGTLGQWKIGRIQVPLPSTAGGWRTKVPQPSRCPNRVSIGPQVTP